MPRGVKKIHNEKRLKIIRRALRNDSTSAEGELWRYLKNRQLIGRKFRRQHSIGPYVVAFYCPAERLAVELDGAVHDDPLRAEHDDARAAYLQERGIRMVRLENDDVFKNTNAVLKGIALHFHQ